MSDPEFAGNLRERIRVERTVSVRDAIGAASSQSEIIGEFWAEAKADGTGDQSESESRAAMQRWRFTLRATEAILPGDILNWNGRSMTIRTVLAEHRPVPKTTLLVEEKR